MATSNYSILLGTELDTTRIRQQLQEIQRTQTLRLRAEVEGLDGVNNFTNSAHQASQAANEVTEATQQTNNAVEDLGLTYQVANQILHSSIEVISQMVERVYDLDDAMVEYRKVSDLSNESLEKYVDKLSDARDSVARTTTELVQGATEFRKSGFSDEDAATLAVVSAQLQNVADEELSAGTAAEFLVSQIQAFNLTADDATHIVDAVNEVSNNFAVSSGDLTKTLPLVSAALSVGNNEFEEMIGLTH